MKKLSLLALIALSTTPIASAHEGGWGHGGSEHDFVLPGVLDNRAEGKTGPCSELKLDASQKSKLKEAYFKFKENKVDLQGRIEKAHLKYKKVSQDAESDLSAAKQASQDVVTAVSNMLQASENYKNEVSFEILKPEQREIARECMMSVMMRRRRHFDGKEERGRAENPGKHGSSAKSAPNHEPDDETSSNNE